MRRRAKRETGRFEGGWVRGLIAGAALLAAVTIGAAIPSEARAQAHVQVEEFSVEMEHAWLSRDGGRYSLDYEVSRSHWRYARDRGLDLYVGAYLPDERDGYEFTHAVRLTSREGYVRFPDHLKYHRGWQLGIGLVAVSSGTHYSSGSGFVVQGPMILDVHHYRRRLGGPSLRFGLVYSRRLSHYGWYGPRFGFSIVIGSHRAHHRKKVIIHRNHRRVTRHKRYHRKKHYRSHRPKVIHHRKKVHHRRHHRSHRPKVIHHRKKVIHRRHKAHRRGHSVHYRKKANRHRAKKQRSHRRHKANRGRSHRRHEANRGRSHRRDKANRGRSHRRDKAERSGRSRSDRAKRGSRGKSRSKGNRR